VRREGLKFITARVRRMVCLSSRSRSCDQHPPDCQAVGVNSTTRAHHNAYHCIRIRQHKASVGSIGSSTVKVIVVHHASGVVVELWQQRSVKADNGPQVPLPMYRPSLLALRWTSCA